MSKISRLNQLPERDKFEYYSLLIPPSLFRRFQIDPATWLNPAGERCVSVEAPASGAEASLGVVSSLRDRDPAFYTEVSDTSDLVQMSWDFVVINDPDAPRFNTDLTPDGGDRWLNWRMRNQTEELMALSSGLAPGQVRVGMRLTHEFNQCLDRFCEAVGFHSITLEALYYHNAIGYERHGFRYFSGEPAMRLIDEGFQPRGALWKLMDDYSHFRKPKFAETIRGRSWAIHDGILEQPRAMAAGYDSWSPPRMYRMVGSRANVNTAPGLAY